MRRVVARESRGEEGPGEDDDACEAGEARGDELRGGRAERVLDLFFCGAGARVSGSGTLRCGAVERRRVRGARAIGRRGGTRKRTTHVGKVRPARDDLPPLDSLDPLPEHPLPRLELPPRPLAPRPRPVHRPRECPLGGARGADLEAVEELGDLGEERMRGDERAEAVPWEGVAPALGWAGRGCV